MHELCIKAGLIRITWLDLLGQVLQDLHINLIHHPSLASQDTTAVNLEMDHVWLKPHVDSIHYQLPLFIIKLEKPKLK